MRKEAVKYQALSGIEGINGCVHFLQLGDVRIVFDAGMDLQNPETGLNKLDLLSQNPHAVFISHAHMDHVGLLPDFIKRFPRSRVYMTYPTAVLSEKMLMHGYLLQQRKFSKGESSYLPSYTDDELERMFYLFQSFGYRQRFNIHGLYNRDLFFSFWDAGHILGSATVLAEWKNKNILYGGNFRLSSQTILKGAKLPPKKIDLLFLEATYGAEDSPLSDYKKETERFAVFLRDILSLNGKVLIPVFALGRTQEILMTISMLIRKSKIPVVPVYITGMGTKITKIYDRLMHKYERKYPNVKLRPLAGHLRYGEKVKGPAVILATSGMLMPGTFSLDLAKQFVREGKNGIAFVGYLSPDFPGYSLREKELEKYREKEEIALSGCKLELFNFSAHADRQELLKAVSVLKPDTTVLFHGEKQSMLELKAELSLHYPDMEILIPEEGKEYELLI